MRGISGRLTVNGFLYRSCGNAVWFCVQFRIYTKLHSKIEQGDQEDSDGGVLIVRWSRADSEAPCKDAGNEAI